MNAVIDEDLHRSLARVLTPQDFSVFDVRDHGLRGSSDDKIYAFSQKIQGKVKHTQRLRLLSSCGETRSNDRTCRKATRGTF